MEDVKQVVQVEVTQVKLELYHQVARHIWAILLLVAEIHLGVKPKWRNRALEN